MFTSFGSPYPVHEGHLTKSVVAFSNNNIPFALSIGVNNARTSRSIFSYEQVGISFETTKLQGVVVQEHFHSRWCERAGVDYAAAHQTVHPVAQSVSTKTLVVGCETDTRERLFSASFNHGFGFSRHVVLKHLKVAFSSNMVDCLQFECA